MKTPEIKTVSKSPLSFIYKNWKGEVAVRDVMPLEIEFTTSEWHGDKPQWFIRGICLEKNEERMFAMKDIRTFVQ